MDTPMTEKPLPSSAQPMGSIPEATGNTTHPRLPCRGCMVDCPNYGTCDGKPWRKVS